MRLRNIDGLIFLWLYRFFPSILNAITVVKPETVIRRHRRSAIDSKSSEVRVRGSLRATETAPLVGTAMKVGYRQAFETTNEFVRIKF
jgi:hypothetical protein